MSTVGRAVQVALLPRSGSATWSSATPDGDPVGDHGRGRAGRTRVTSSAFTGTASQHRLQGQGDRRAGGQRQHAPGPPAAPTTGAGPRRPRRRAARRDDSSSRPGRQRGHPAQRRRRRAAPRPAGSAPAAPTPSRARGTDHRAGQRPPRHQAGQARAARRRPAAAAGSTRSTRCPTTRAAPTASSADQRPAGPGRGPAEQQQDRQRAETAQSSSTAARQRGDEVGPRAAQHLLEHHGEEAHARAPRAGRPARARRAAPAPGRRRPPRPRRRPASRRTPGCRWPAPRPATRASWSDEHGGQPADVAQHVAAARPAARRRPTASPAAGRWCARRREPRTPARRSSRRRSSQTPSVRSARRAERWRRSRRVRTREPPRRSPPDRPPGPARGSARAGSTRRGRRARAAAASARCALTTCSGEGGGVSQGSSSRSRTAARASRRPAVVSSSQCTRRMGRVSRTYQRLTALTLTTASGGAGPGPPGAAHRRPSTADGDHRVGTVGPSGATAASTSRISGRRRPGTAPTAVPAEVQRPHLAEARSQPASRRNGARGTELVKPCATTKVSGRAAGSGPAPRTTMPASADAVVGAHGHRPAPGRRRGVGGARRLSCALPRQRRREASGDAGRPGSARRRHATRAHDRGAPGHDRGAARAGAARPTRCAWWRPSSPACSTATPGDVVLVDARHDLVRARDAVPLLASTGVAASVVAVLSEGGLVALSADWGVDDVLLDTAGPAEVDARLKWATARRLAAATPVRRRRTRRHHRPASWSSTSTATRPSCAAGRSTSPTRSSSCSSTWPSTRAGSSPAPSCCRRSGATTTSAAPAPSTSTSAGCGPSSAPSTRR